MQLCESEDVIYLNACLSKGNRSMWLEPWPFIGMVYVLRLKETKD